MRQLEVSNHHLTLQVATRDQTIMSLREDISEVKQTLCMAVTDELFLILADSSHTAAQEALTETAQLRLQLRQRDAQINKLTPSLSTCKQALETALAEDKEKAQRIMALEKQVCYW